MVAASFIAVETFLVYLLKARTPGNACGIFYLPGILVVSIVWGFGLAAYLSFFVGRWILFCRYRDPELATIVRRVAARPGDHRCLGLAVVWRTRHTGCQASRERGA